MGKHEKIEERVKKHLDAVHAIEGGWDALLAIVHRRGIQRQLREARIAQGLTQAEVAERMDIKQGQLSEMENVRYPDYRISTLGRWAHALGVEWRWGIYEIPKEKDEECEGL